MLRSHRAASPHARAWDSEGRAARPSMPMRTSSVERRRDESRCGSMAPLRRAAAGTRTGGMGGMPISPAAHGAPILTGAGRAQFDNLDRSKQPSRLIECSTAAAAKVKWHPPRLTASSITSRQRCASTPRAHATHTSASSSLTCTSEQWTRGCRQGGVVSKGAGGRRPRARALAPRCGGGGGSPCAGSARCPPRPRCRAPSLLEARQCTKTHLVLQPAGLCVLCGLRHAPALLRSAYCPMM